MQEYDVLIVGGGPAGLNAALVLGRCYRKTAVFDAGNPRNMYTAQMHNFITRDGTAPMDFLKMAKEEVMRYDIPLFKTEIIDAKKLKEGFQIVDQEGNYFFGKKLLIATGLKDCIPRIQGIPELYGKSVHHCPYCDGYEYKGKILGAIGYGKPGTGLAISLLTWTDHVLLLTDGKTVNPKEKERLFVNGIEPVHYKIDRVEGENGRLRSIVFDNGESIPCDGLFFSTEKYQRSHLADQLGCKFNEKNVLVTNELQETSVPGCYAAGDADKDMQLVVVAASEGAKAAVAINNALQKQAYFRKLEASMG